MEIEDAMGSGKVERVEAVQAAWRQRATTAWSDTVAKGPQSLEKKKKKKKKQRAKAYSWLLASERQLWACSPLRWRDFYVADDTDQPPSSWRALSLSIDQGSDGWSAANYLLYHERAAIVVVKDLHHRLWNDTWLALSRSQWRPFMTLAMTTLNMDHGPWSSHRWFEEGVAVCRAYQEIAGPDCALFQR